MYGLSDIDNVNNNNNNNPSDSEYVVYLPYNALMPNSEGSSLRYPISFYNPRIESGCICYNVKPGICENGMKYVSFANNSNNNI
jgi:hypothetical protein